MNETDRPLLVGGWDGLSWDADPRLLVPGFPRAVEPLGVAASLLARGQALDGLPWELTWEE